MNNQIAHIHPRIATLTGVARTPNPVSAGITHTVVGTADPITTQLGLHQQSAGAVTAEISVGAIMIAVTIGSLLLAAVRHHRYDKRTQ